MIWIILIVSAAMVSLVALSYVGAGATADEQMRRHRLYAEARKLAPLSSLPSALQSLSAKYLAAIKRAREKKDYSADLEKDFLFLQEEIQLLSREAIEQESKVFLKATSSTSFKPSPKTGEGVITNKSEKVYHGTAFNH